MRFDEKGFFDQLIPEVAASRRRATDEEIVLHLLDRVEECVKYGELAAVAMDLPGYLRMRPNVLHRLDSLLHRGAVLRQKLVDQGQQNNVAATQLICQGVDLAAKGGDFGGKVLGRLGHDLEAE